MEGGCAAIVKRVLRAGLVEKTLPEQDLKETEEGTL